MGLKVGIARDERFLEHKTGHLHPEHPKRLTSIYRMIDQEFTGKVIDFKPQPAALEHIERVHTPGHIRQMLKTAELRLTSLAPDTPVSATSYLAAWVAVGACLQGVDYLIAHECDAFFALVRPPGHHALPDRAGGFCLFNNIAIAALYAIEKYKLERILVIDWDIHHGNGIHDFFYEDRRVFYFSTHDLMLYQRGVYIEAKPFSIGFRIEHPQALIDSCRFGSDAGNPVLGAADYKLVHHCKNGRSVYSFCMCPGGTVVAATSEPGRVVTNGMSQYSRNERNANAGIVVGISPEQDFPGGPLAGIELQERLESLAYELGGRDYCAPAQLVGDFIRGVPSTAFGEIQPSYKPGVRLGDLAGLLPPDAVEAIREALPEFGRQIRGFDRDDAILTGIESRTSSPVRVTRDRESLQSVNVRGLYPGGEGAGYAGGILSAGVDGIRIAEALALSMLAGAGSAAPAPTHDAA